MNDQATELVEVKKPEASAMLFLDVPAKFILEVASGLRPPEDIAADYGFTPVQWLELKEYPPFVKQVDDKKAELKLSGFTFRMKAALMAEDLLDKLDAHAQVPDVSFHTTLELAKFTARAAGLDSPVKEEDGKTGGAKFSITINLGAGKTVHIGDVQKDVEDIEFEEVCEEDSEDSEEILKELTYDSTKFFAPFSVVPLSA